MIHSLRFIVNKLSQRISAMSMMDGIELLIRRHQEAQHVSAGTFYLFKIYTLYELAIENDNEDYRDVIKSVMDGSYTLKKKKKRKEALPELNSINRYLFSGQRFR
ncbi:hypothetical protein CU097_006199 [Rhizopus azygosporus]|uniref:Uncharacterized protein n=1 Tax=Rhizopus azygosporus TaxID=86630 RepID=A0A367J2S5_RHIAZ|nr:hypothetical protein CU097_006199 [Rhizopus azygosporus]